METNYDRFYRAMLILVGQGDLKERVARAYQTEIQQLEISSLSDNVREELEAIREELTHGKGSDAVQAAVSEMSEDDVAQLAAQFLDLYEEIIRGELN